MSVENSRAEASSGGTAINQVNAKYFLVFAREYNVPIYNVTYNKAEKSAATSPLSRINNAVQQVRALYENNDFDEGDRLLSKTFEVYYDSPEFVLSDKGLLTMTNLQILDGQRQERENTDGEAHYDWAVAAYLYPLKYLTKRPALEQDYVKRIIDKPVLLRTQEGLSFVISRRCPSDAETRCPGLLALRFKLRLEHAKTEIEIHDTVTEIAQFLAATRQNTSVEPSIIKGGSLMAVRLNLIADVLDYFKPAFLQRRGYAGLSLPVSSALSADLENLKFYYRDETKIGDDEKIVATRFVMLLLQDSVFFLATVAAHKSDNDLTAALVNTQDLTNELPANQRLTGYETQAAMKKCIDRPVDCEPGRVVWSTVTAPHG